MVFAFVLFATHIVIMGAWVHGSPRGPEYKLIIASPSYPSSIVRATYVAAGRTG